MPEALILSAVTNKAEAAVEEKFKAYCAPLNSRHFNRYLFIERKQQDGETVDEFFCSALKTLAKNCDLGDKEESWITSMLVLGPKDPFSKERVMEREQSLEKTLQGARIAETSKQHMTARVAKLRKWIKLTAKDISLKGRQLLGAVVFDRHQIHVLLLGDAAVTV